MSRHDALSEKTTRAFVLYVSGLFESKNFPARNRPDNPLGVGLITAQDISEKAKQEALHWLIALQEDPDDGDVRARLDAWLDAGRDNRAAWAEARHVWNVLGEVGEASAATMPGPAPPRATPHALTAGAALRRPWRARPLAMAAAGLAAVCFAVLFQPVLAIWLAADYSTGTAEIRDIRLEDGSTVHLGAGSAIEVAYEPAKRGIRLLAGEAYFEVVPDRSRPFQVEAGNVGSLVLGTAFDVRMTTDGVSVAVNHGRVGVTAPQARGGLEDPLEAGDWVHVDWSGQVERGKDAPELVGGWRSGMLVVKDRRISEVIDEIRRHYGGRIVLADSDLGRRRVTGVYDLGKPLDALRALAQVHGANARQIGPWVTIVSRY